MARSGSVGLAVLLVAATFTVAPAPHAAGVAPEAAEPAVAALVPQPVVVDRPADAEPWRLRGTTDVYAAAAARPVARRFARELATASGRDVRVTGRPSGADVVLDVDPRADYEVDGSVPEGERAEESYVLDVTARGVTLTARHPHGAFNGVQTLRQLLPPWIGSKHPVTTAWEVPAIHVEDAPRFSYRGVMLDVARSFQEVGAVKRYIDTLAGLKMSVLHLHLADDQGWRIEITNKGRAAGDTIDYRRLTGVSGRTAMDPQQGFRNELGRSGFYTQDEYREIVEYARDRFVTVVPEVDVPSHTNAALHAIPQLNTDRSLPASDPETGVVDWNGTGNVGYSALDEQHDPTYDFVRHVFAQLAEMTGGPYVHMGGDESHDMGHERYVDFVEQAVPAVREASGTGVMGWTEYAEAGLTQGPGYWEGSVVQYWVGSGDWVRDFVAKGGKAVVSAAGGSYIDQKYDPTTPIGLSWACSGDCDVPQYYGWDPTTTVEGGVPEEGVLGVEAPLWSETIRGEDQAFYLSLPRAAAVLETGWSNADRKDLAGFVERLGGLGPHLTVAGTNFYETRRVAWTPSAAGQEVRARRGLSAVHDVGLVAAPGTKVSADGAGLVPDRVTTDADPASDSTLTEPLTASLVCDGRDLPVTFVQEQARDSLHGAGVFTAQVRHAFTRATTCSLVPSSGEPVPVRVRLGSTADDRHTGASGRARIEVGGGRAVDTGSWVPFRISGFAPHEYVDLAVDGERVYSVRTDARGRFDRFALIPRGTDPGLREVTASQGARRATAAVRVR